MLDTFQAAQTSGPYDEYPVLPAEVDPQLTLSRNDRPQPFYLTCAKDCVLAQMSGSGRLLMRDSAVRYFDLIPGDYVYVPAGTPHRMMPSETSIQYRFKAANSGLEAVSFYCEACNQELHTVTWDTEQQSPQAGYLRATSNFNASPEQRTCSKCGAVHPAIDLAGFRWAEIATELTSTGNTADW
jgi:3-hydroxyanthranilate 3,4-dioxygenase